MPIRTQPWTEYLKDLIINQNQLASQMITAVNQAMAQVKMQQPLNHEVNNAFKRQLRKQIYPIMMQWNTVLTPTQQLLYRTTTDQLRAQTKHNLGFDILTSDLMRDYGVKNRPLTLQQYLNGHYEPYPLQISMDTVTQRRYSIIATLEAVLLKSLQHH